MGFPDLLQQYPDLAEGVRGKLTSNQPLSAVTWFRTGGPAQLMFQPADEEDLAAFLKKLPADIPVLPVGLGSNPACAGRWPGRGRHSPQRQGLWYH